jgi:hypothetical protein
MERSQQRRPVRSQNRSEQGHDRAHAPDATMRAEPRRESTAMTNHMKVRRRENPGRNNWIAFHHEPHSDSGRSRSGMVCIHGSVGSGHPIRAIDSQFVNRRTTLSTSETTCILVRWPAIRMSRSTPDRANKTGLVGPDPFEDPMGKPRKEHPDEESIFASNPFIEGFFEWMDSPEGEKHLAIYDVLSKLLEDVHLDARKRKVIWPDGRTARYRAICSAHPETVPQLPPRRDRGVYDRLD